MGFAKIAKRLQRGDPFYTWLKKGPPRCSRLATFAKVCKPYKRGDIFFRHQTKGTLKPFFQCVKKWIPRCSKNVGFAKMCKRLQRDAPFFAYSKKGPPRAYGLPTFANPLFLQLRGVPFWNIGKKGCHAAAKIKGLRK